jgi:GAF domain-containing protein
LRHFSPREGWQWQEEQMAELIKPNELKKVAEAKEMLAARQALEAEQKRAEERLQIQAAFLNRQIQPDGRERLRRALIAAAERGADHLQILTFPSDLCTDGGRAINNADPNWPTTLVGFAARAYEFFDAELRPHGYRLRAEIVDFPGGKPGDVAITLAW